MTEINSAAEIKTAVDAIFIKNFELDPGDLLEEKHLYEDFGLDSLDAIDMVIAFQRQFKIKPPEEEVRSVRTLGDVYKLVEKYNARVS